MIAEHVIDADTQSEPSVKEEKHVNTAHAYCTVYTPDLQQSGLHNTIQAHTETEISL